VIGAASGEIVLHGERCILASMDRDCHDSIAIVDIVDIAIVSTDIDIRVHGHGHGHCMISNLGLHLRLASLGWTKWSTSTTEAS
jgi:hypothetical protein